jgi:hypothetical protein
MKKVFLSLAVVAVLTVVSCKKADASAEEVMAVDSTEVVVDTMAVDTAAVVMDSAAVEAPAAE